MLKSTVLIVSFYCVLCYSQSPCPSFFRYMINYKTKEIFGRIKIPFPPKNIVLHLRVSLSVATALPTAYVGKIELGRPKRETIIAINEDQPIIYDIFFPVQSPIPLLSEILFNNHQYCIGPPAIGPAVTNIFLEHFLYPPVIDDSIRVPTKKDNQEVFNLFNNQSIKQQQPQPVSRDDFAISTHLNNVVNINTASESPVNLHEICGAVNYHNPYLSTPSDRTLPGQWPWLAAIFIVRISFQFQCVGNLVTDKHILTAAHCKEFNGQELNSNNFIASLGRYRLDNWREESLKNVEIEEFIVHPEYENRASAHADLGLIILPDKVQFTPAISPICLWTGPTDLNNIVGNMGYVIGWGRNTDNKQNFGELRMSQVPIISQEECLRSNIAFFYATSDKTFCAGNKDGRGPCNGDSGSGLVILNRLTGKYHLRGIVSLSLLDRNSSSLCNLYEYVVYADVAKFLDWINSKIQRQ